MIQLIDAIAQYEAKLKTPTMIKVLHLVASGKSPSMEIGTTIPTKIDKASVTLKDPKRPFPLFTLYFPVYSSVFCRSNCLHYRGDTNPSTAAEHLDGSLPPCTVEVVNHLSKVYDPGRANGMAQRNGAARRIHSGI